MVPDNSAGIPRAPAYSGAAPVQSAFRVRAFHPLRGSVPAPSATLLASFGRSYNPGTRRNAAGLGCSPFARRYWGNRCYFLFLQVLRCFSSLRSPRCSHRCGDRSPRVAPFGYLRVYAHLPLAAAFRSLSRPSSPPRAQASPMRP